MSTPVIPPKPNTVVASMAYKRLGDAGFTQLPDDSSRPRTQLWKNARGKTVSVDFTDETFQFCWEESLDTALKRQYSVPAHPWSPWWATILGSNYRPSD
ncbi:hypothetical protein [Bradyrhizobium japonicum]|uniref:hypothetical protein n=1 Tax=Bradyrhizobium japonicum TaxID=375 RepID=UPI0012BBB358|nr:hypothetical protein [Bradyrhizobium japonicum]